MAPERIHGNTLDEPPEIHRGAAEIGSRVAAGEVSAVSVMAAFLQRIEIAEPSLNAFVEVFWDDARAEAAALDGRRAAGESMGPLAGVPVAVKDNLSLAGRSLSCASKILDGYVAPYTATAVERLRAAGAIVVGRTNLDEMAMGSSCETSRWGPTRNPWDRERVPGGSSGGSAAAVAAAMVPLAVGSDTGGSVRQPAAFCGVVGLRPTYGRVSRHGLVAFASSLDQVGPIANSVEDVALALEVMAGADPRDGTTAKEEVPSWGQALSSPSPSLPPRPLEGLRCGVLPTIGDTALAGASRAGWGRALEHVADLGAELVPMVVQSLERALAIYSVLAPCEASSNLARFDGVRFGRRAEGVESMDELYVRSRTEGFGTEVKRRILMGTYALSSGYRDGYYDRARRARQRLRRELWEALGRVDVLVSPTTPSSAFLLGDRGEPLDMYRCDVFTCGPSLAGAPAVAVPAGLDDNGLPISLQVIGAPFDEAMVLRVAAAFEAHRRRDEGQLRPPMPWLVDGKAVA